MSENGPLLYRVKPLYDSCPNIILPTCMYKMNSIYQTKTSGVGILGSSVDEDEQLIELEKQQLSIIQKLEELRNKVLQMKDDYGVKNIYNPVHFDGFQDIVIKANPSCPPLSVWVFYHLLSKSIATKLVTYCHSSLKSLPESVLKLPSYVSDETCNISFTIIWKEGLNDNQIMVNPIHQGPIEGEVNFARYISRLTSFNYELDPVVSTQIDDWLEMVHSSIVHGNNKERQNALKSLNSHLGKNSYCVGNCLSVADIVMWSVIVQNQLHSNLATNVAKWFKLLQNSDIFLPMSDFISL